MDLEKIEVTKHAQILYQSLRDLNRKKIKEISTHTNSSDISNNGGIEGLINNAEQIIGRAADCSGGALHDDHRDGADEEHQRAGDAGDGLPDPDEDGGQVLHDRPPLLRLLQRQVLLHFREPAGLGLLQPGPERWAWLTVDSNRIFIYLDAKHQFSCEVYKNNLDVIINHKNTHNENYVKELVISKPVKKLNMKNSIQYFLKFFPYLKNYLSRPSNPSQRERPGGQEGEDQAA